jgi:hypothetical protein
MTAPSLYDLGAAALFVVGMVVGWVIRSVYEETR